MRWCWTPRMRGQKRKPSMAKAAKLISVLDVSIGVVLFDLELALVVKQTVQHKGGITIGALNRQAVERRVVIGHEGVKLQGEVAESGAVGLLEDPAWQREALPVACGGLALAPACGGGEVRDRAHQFRQGAPLR